MKKQIFLLIVTSLFLSLCITTAAAFLLADKPDKRDREFSRMLAGRVHDVINDEILKPLLVSQAMAHDELLIEWLQSEDSRSPDDNIVFMERYLRSFKEHFGYTASFLVSDKSKYYYTYRGLNKILNPLNDPHDKWYPIFLKKDCEFELNADTDQVNGDHWTVFVNCRICDKNGKLLGVCGVGMVMDNLQDIMRSYESQYGVKIDLVDSNGFVQMASDSSNNKQSYLNNVKLDASNDDFSVRQEKNSLRISKYLKGLGWYLVVQTGENKPVSKLRPLILLDVLFFIVLSLLFYGLIKLIDYRFALKKDEQSTEDALTALPNYHYFSEAYGENGIFTTTRYKALIIFDIDHFCLAAEENRGDELIERTAAFAKELFEGKGLLFRWQYDTFLVLFEYNTTEAKKICNLLSQKLASDSENTVSAGIASIDLTATIKKNFYRAMQALNKAKESGGNATVIF